MAPRVAAMRAACKKQERDVAALTAQLRAAGIQPLVSPSASRCCLPPAVILLLANLQGGLLICAHGSAGCFLITLKEYVVVVMAITQNKMLHVAQKGA